MQTNDLQRLVIQTGITVFGEDNVRNPTERLMRFLEEAIELVRAGGLSDEGIRKVFEFEMGRPVGTNLQQELAGAGVTLLAVAHSQNLSLEAAILNDVDRLLDNVEHHRRKRAAKPAEVRA